MSDFNLSLQAFASLLAKRCLGLCLACVVVLPPARADLHHALEVKLRPEEHAVSVVDSITLDGTGGSVEFELHPDMEPEVLTEGVRLEALEANTPPAPDAEAAVIPRRYRVLLPAGQDRFVLRYQGRIRHALHPQGEDYARGFSETAGMIDDQGVFLADRELLVSAGGGRTADLRPRSSPAAGLDRHDPG